MEDILRQLSVILRGMWLYRWWGLAAAWIVGPIAAATVYLLPDRYESSARVYVDTQSILKPLMSGLAVQPNVDQQISILSRTLISRPNVEKLIRMADLDLTVKTKEEREALILVGASGFSYEDAAAICGCAVGTIKSRVNRARSKLSALLYVEGAEDFGPDNTIRAVIGGGSG